MRPAAIVCLALLLPFSCQKAAAEPAARSGTASWPLRFFAGHTRGEGTLRVLISPAKRIQVHSTGRIAEDGTLVLRQTIRQGDAAPSLREWRLRRIGGGRYFGTLTDAAGTVTGEASNRRLHLRYTMRGALRLRIEQRLELQPDGRTVENRLSASKFGLPVASVRETIRKGR